MRWVQLDEATVLDLCCGTGTFLINLLETHAVTKAYGIDLSSNQIAIAGRKADAHGISHANYIVHSVEKVRQKKAETIVGGLNVTAGNDGTLLTCQWLLQAVGVPT